MEYDKYHIILEYLEFSALKRIPMNFYFQFEILYILSIHETNYHL